MEENKLYDIGRETNTIYDRIYNYLQDKYELRFNEIALIYQIKHKDTGTKWQQLNLSSLLIELTQAGIKTSPNILEIYLKSHFISRYNPIRGYFKNLLDWDGKDYIGELCNYIKTDNDSFFRYHFEKWLVRAVLCALEEGRINKQCLVLSSQQQNVGKSTFWRFIVPKKLNEFYSEDMGTDKDSLIKLSKNFIINLDELAIQGQRNINALKAFISKTHINERLPYGKRQERLERICSFIGSTNETDFLTDETGNVRWVIFQVMSIDFAYTKEVDIDKVWSQAYYKAYKLKDYNPELTKQDIMENESRNKSFMHWTMEKELVAKYFEYGIDEKKDFMTATDVLLELENHGIKARINKIQIGKALTSLGFPEKKHGGINRGHGYLVVKKIMKIT